MNHRRTKEQDWQRGPEVAGGSYRSRVSLATEKWQRRRRDKTSANVLSMFWTVWRVEFAVTRTPEGERGKRKKLIASSGQFAHMSGKKSCSDFVKTFFSVLIAVLRSRRRQWTCGERNHMKCFTRPGVKS